MKKTSLVIISLFISLWANTLIAAPVIVSAEFSGDEPLMQNQFADGENAPLPYLTIGPVTVSSNGTYEFQDGRFAFDDTDVTVSVHTAGFNPANPQATQQAVLDDYGDVTLMVNTNYTLVVQPYYSDQAFPAALGFVLDGAGTISGSGVVPRPPQFAGSFSGNEGLTNIIPESIGCADSYHDAIGPFTVDRVGVYWFGSTSTMVDGPGMPLAMGVYENSFDPGNPYNNQLAVFPDQGFVTLETGKNYYLVLQPDCDLLTGDWSYIMAPPADELVWTPYMSGSWYDKLSDGSGAYLDVLPDINAVSMAWFTWDNVAPTPDPNPDVADPGTRWLTALGFFDGSNPVVEMTVYGSTGGIFNTGAPVTSPPVGTMTLEMFNFCDGGEFRFNLDSGLSGTAKMQRVVDSNLVACAEQDARPGVFKP